jgi:hypothetical protein
MLHFPGQALAATSPPASEDTKEIRNFLYFPNLGMGSVLKCLARRKRPAGGAN